MNPYAPAPEAAKLYARIASDSSVPLREWASVSAADGLAMLLLFGLLNARAWRVSGVPRG